MSEQRIDPQIHEENQLSEENSRHVCTKLTKIFVETCITYCHVLYKCSVNSEKKSMAMLHIN